MAGQADGSIIINTEVNADGFNSGINDMQSGIGKFGKSLKRLGAIIAATFAVDKLVDFSREAIELGSDLQEVQNVVDVTFTTMSDKVDEFAKSAAKTAGLSETMAKKYTGTFGSMAKAIGYTEEEAFEMSTTLTQLSGDVASFYNLTQEEAYTKLKAVFSGETEGLRDLGVMMTQASLDAYALAKGFGMTTDEMTEQQKTALRYQFVVDRLSDASGDYVRTLGSWANQTKTLQLNINSLKANIGQGLINLFTPLLQVLNAVIERLMVVGTMFKEFTERIMGKNATESTSNVTESLSDLGEGYGLSTEGIKDYTDATEEATKANKKSLSSFDDLNMLTAGIADNLGDASFDGLVIGGGNANTEGMLEEIESPGSIISNFKEKLKEFFDEIDWKNVGGNVAESLTRAFKKIKWKNILMSTGNFFETLVDAAIDLWKGSFETAPFETGLISAIATAKFLGLDKTLANIISSHMPTNIHVGKTILLLGITWKLGEEIGKFLGSVVFPDDKAYYENFSWFGENGFFDNLFNTDKDIHKKAISLWKEDIVGAIDEIKQSFKDGGWREAMNLWLEDITTNMDAMSNDLEAWLERNIGEWAGLTFEEAGIALSDFGKTYITEPLRLWGMDIEDWWNEDVTPWFTQRKWEGLLNNVKQAFRDIFNQIINSLNEKFNNFVNGIVEKFNSIFSNGNVSTGAVSGITGGVTVPRIAVPQLATGAVIPPNAPFLAMLGDQRNGTNIETPEGLLRQIVREEMAQIDVNVTFDVEGDEEKIFKVTQKQARMFTRQTGKPAYPTGG